MSPASRSLLLSSRRTKLGATPRLVPRRSQLSCCRWAILPPRLGVRYPNLFLAGREPNGDMGPREPRITGNHSLPACVTACPAVVHMLSAGAAAAQPAVTRLPTARPPPLSVFQPDPPRGTGPRLPSRLVPRGRSARALGRKPSVQRPGGQRLPRPRPPDHGPSRSGVSVPRNGRSTPQPWLPRRSDSTPPGRIGGRRPGRPGGRPDDGSPEAPSRRTSRRTGWSLCRPGRSLSGARSRDQTRRSETPRRSK